MTDMSFNVRYTECKWRIWKGERTKKLVKTWRKERHVSDSCLQTAAEGRESGKSRQETGAFNQHCDFYQL
jgi:hypothetical protein